MRRFFVLVALMSLMVLLGTGCFSLSQEGPSETPKSIVTEGEVVSASSSDLPVTAEPVTLHKSIASNGTRYALVLGNGAYHKTTPLANPVKDASDIAKLLEEVGFSVTLETNASLSQMEATIREFSKTAKASSAETTLFYYAGHGVQFEGVNYLLPVDADIQRDYELRSKAVSMDLVSSALHQTDSAFNLILLDACRDNPFSLTRGGARGLMAMGGGNAETMVVFSTSPGSVAQDGSGDNSPFTTALKQNLKTPDLEVRQLIAAVSKSVQEMTKGVQIPWMNTSFTGSFFFVPTGQQGTQALGAQMLAEKGGQSENLDTKGELIDDNNALALQAYQADAEKKEQQRARSSGALGRLEAIAEADLAIEAIGGRFRVSLERTKQELESLKTQMLDSYKSANPIDPWESSSEFSNRVRIYGSAIDRDNAAKIRDLELQRDSEIEAIDLDRMKGDLQEMRFTVGSDIIVSPFDVDTKRFPMKAVSLDTAFPFELPFYYAITKTERDDLQREYQRIDDADKAGALTGELTYALQEVSPGIWSANIVSGRMLSVLEGTGDEPAVLISFAEDVSPLGSDLLFMLQAGKVRNVYGAVPIASITGVARVYVGSKEIGTTDTLYIAETAQEAGRQSFRLVLENGVVLTLPTFIQSGMNKTVYPSFSRGSVGPAGGYIFYDKGSYSDGWRYLEAAPASTEWIGYVGGGSRSSVEGTMTGIGTGAKNTEKIIAKFGSAEPYGNKANYAAMVCSSLRYGGYSDWFLPSRDELDLMYTSLHKKGLGGFSGAYWSSSETYGYRANYTWAQSFNSGNQGHGDKDFSEYRVRAARAF